jgi:hypothetical protein
MKLTTLLGAALIAASPAHAYAHHDHQPMQVAMATSSTPAYARALAFETCRNQRAGMSSTAAIRKALDDLWPIYGADITRDTSAVAARYVVAERIILCGELQ